MELPRLNKTIRKIIHLQQDDSGNVTPIVIYRKDENKRKVSPMLQPLDKAVRRVMRAQASFVDTYLGKHERSNAKRKDGFVGDFIPNVAEASRNFGKKLRIKKMAMS